MNRMATARSRWQGQYLDGLRTTLPGGRAGVSLIEVLVSMAVLTIGLLGLAALIPLGRLAMVETGKADRSGACGHAARHQIKVRRMLEYDTWWPAGQPPPPWWPAVENPYRSPGRNPALSPPIILSVDSFAIDPMGATRGITAKLGGENGLIPRITLKGMESSSALADRVFRWHDDLEFSMPEDIDPRPIGESDRPRTTDLSGVPQAKGAYSWLVTVTPAAAEAGLPLAARTVYSVSVVVCFKRGFLLENEHTAEVDFLGGPGWGGGSVQLKNSNPHDPALQLRENEWIMLCGAVPDGRFTSVSGKRLICKWYRVASADAEKPTKFVSLVGPDWTVDSDGDGNLDAQAVTIDHVVGVYTSTVELDRNLSWER